MISRGAARLTTCGVVACGLLLLSACQSQGPDATTQQSSTVPSPSTPSPSTSLTLPSPTPYVEPADGPLIDFDSASIHGLKDYRFRLRLIDIQEWGNETSAVMIMPLNTPDSLDEMAQDRFDRKSSRAKYKRLENVAVAGRYSAFHILDTGDPTEELHLYGIRYLDGSWMIDFVFYNDIADPLTDEERQEVMDSILASFETHRESPTSSAP